MFAVLGGVIIGIAVTVMLLFNGRVAGISGIIGGLLRPAKADWVWRLCFLLGLLGGGLLLRTFYPSSLDLSPSIQKGDYVLAGFLVGFGTLLGNGCTSGHGVCGISRLSVRSIISTMIFIVFGIIGLYSFALLRGGH